MANGNAALSDALGTTPALLGGLGKKRTIEGRGQYAAEKYGEALEGQTAAELEARTKKGEAKVAGLEAEAEAERELGRTMQRQGEELEAGLKSYEKFEAPEYTASDYAADAAKRLLVGLLIGGTTRLSGEGQLRAIKAMQDAEDQGLEEQFTQARMAFDENEKARVEHNKRLQDRFARLKELATQDRAAAMVEAKLLGAQMENGSIAADLRAGNYLKAIKQFEDAMKLENQFQLAQLKAAQKATRVGQLPTTLQKTLESTGKTQIALNRAFATKEDRFFGIAPNDAVAKTILSGVELGLPVGEIMSMVGYEKAPKVTPDAVNWWKNYNSFVALVRNELFGATLTKAERETFREFTIYPSTDPKVADNYFRTQIETLEKAARRERAKARAFGASDELIDAYLDVTPREEAPKPRTPTAGGPRPMEFNSIEEADAAFKRGEIQVGDEIRVGGRKAEYTEE